MFRLKSITSKILLSYLIVVICSIVVTTLSFHSIMYRDLERRAFLGLTRQARDIAFILERDNLYFKPPLESPHRRSLSVFFTGRSVESEYVVVDLNRTIIYSSLPEQFPVGQQLEELPVRTHADFTLKNDEISTFQNNTFLVAQAPIGKQGERKGTVYTFAQVSVLEAFSKDLLYILLKSLLLATIMAIPVALIMARYLIKPINALREYAKALAKRRFDVRLEIKSDDELAELANTFNDMAAQLERYDISMRRFLQRTSHELKTPLMSIQGYAEGIRDRVFTGAQLDQALTVISKECQRLKTIVDEMINITRLQNPGESYNLLPQDLRQILEEVADSLGGYAVERKVRLTIEIPTGVKVIGDREKLRRLFGNLLTNAIRHAKSQVRVHTTSEDLDTFRKIIVQDDGNGFSPQDLEHAFDYFYKGSNGSTGLGLSIARIIVEEHGGTIEIKNAPDGGALVEVTLP